MTIDRGNENHYVGPAHYPAQLPGSTPDVSGVIAEPAAHPPHQIAVFGLHPLQTADNSHPQSLPGALAAFFLGFAAEAVFSGAIRWRRTRPRRTPLVYGYKRTLQVLILSEQQTPGNSLLFFQVLIDLPDVGQLFP
ncbi:MAG: hypothetical protein SV487_13185 [Thermodesulfobacteriota bacterium]|nr:hypothetical protein [Thermodesulfobacteriota bacterium]